MEKYRLVNWQTQPFKKKSFEGQLDRYAKCCVVSAATPNKVLDVICVFGDETLIKLVHKCELGEGHKALLEYLMEPVEGEFVDVKSLHGPLYHIYSMDEAQYGLCSMEDVGKAERDNNKKVKVYHSIKVFSLYISLEDIVQKQYIIGWSPSKMYYRYYGYRYRRLSDLTEPLQL